MGEAESRLQEASKQSCQTRSKYQRDHGSENFEERISRSAAAKQGIVFCLVNLDCAFALLNKVQVLIILVVSISDLQPMYIQFSHSDAL